MLDPRPPCPLFSLHFPYQLILSPLNIQHQKWKSEDSLVTSVSTTMDSVALMNSNIDTALKRIDIYSARIDLIITKCLSLIGQMFEQKVFDYIIVPTTIPEQLAQICTRSSLSMDPEPPIFRLPTELLYEILNHVVPYYECLFTSRKDYSNVFAIRATCRAFRILSSELKFWYDDKFCYTRLVPRILHSSDKFDAYDFETRAQGLLDTLAADKRLMQTMGRRKDWSFRSLLALSTIDRCIPSFRNTVTGLSLEFFSPDYISEFAPLPTVLNLNLAVEFLVLCPNLTSLDLFTADGTKLYLDTIASSCSSLKSLRLFCDGGWTGSLRGLHCLERYSIMDCSLHFGIIERVSLLPLDSASSLTDLYLYGMNEYPYNLDALVTFINLKSCRIIPLTNTICDLIHRARFTNLRTFGTVIRGDADISPENMLRIFSATSFDHLQSLTFLMEPLLPTFNACYFGIIQAIISHLSSTLEELGISCGINTAWCEYFCYLRNLREFTWIAVDCECVDTPDPFAFPLTMHNVDDTCLPQVCDTMMDKIRSEFRKFGRELHIDVEVLPEHQYDSWDLIIE